MGVISVSLLTSYLVSQPVGVVELAKEPKARRGIIDVETDRGKVNAEGETGDEGKWVSK